MDYERLPEPLMARQASTKQTVRGDAASDERLASWAGHEIIHTLIHSSIHRLFHSTCG